MKTRGSSKLTKKERKNLILGLCRAVVVLKTPEEVANALTDLLSPKEIETIAKRLQIAEMLARGGKYQNIREDLKVGYSTIARVNTWLNLSGEGYKMMLSRRKKTTKDESEQELYDPYSWHNIKRRCSIYFWPQLVIEEFLKNADKKEKRKMEDIFEKLEIKKHRFRKEENKALYEMFSGGLGINNEIEKENK